jgi:hypothetical protein
MPAKEGNPGVLRGDWWVQEDSSTPPHLSIISDPTAPQSPPRVLSYDYTAGTNPGYSGPPGAGLRLFAGWAKGATESVGVEMRAYYESTRFKMQGPDFETQQVGVKVLGYWGVAKNNIGSLPVQMWSLFGGNGTSNVPLSSWPIHLAYEDQILGGTALYQNTNQSKLVQADTWHRFEMRATLNDIGSANGVWKWWLDGILIGDYSNLTFIDASHPSGFWGRHVDGVWGGGGGAVKSRTDHVLFDHMYLSGIPK